MGAPLMAWPSTSPASRGYGPAWKKLVKLVKARDGELCQPCLKLGQVHRGNEVDHIVSKDEAKRRGWSENATNDLKNLQCICTEAHKAKTQAEQGKTLRVRTVPGDDGWPVRG